MVRSCSPNDAHFKLVSFLACSSLSATTKPPFPFPLITPGCSHFLSIFNNVGIFNWRKMLNYLFNVAEEVSGPHGVGNGGKSRSLCQQRKMKLEKKPQSFVARGKCADRQTYSNVALSSPSASPTIISLESLGRQLRAPFCRVVCTQIANEVQKAEVGAESWLRSFTS